MKLKMCRFTIVLFVLFITLTSWKADIKGPWIITSGKQVILCTRPLNFSKSESPDSVTIQKIIQEQEKVIDFINKKLNTSFTSKVKIYLFNEDEAKDKIGTNGGGFASLNKFKRHIYFTFHTQPYFNTVMNTYDYLGVHEMVHIITLNELGNIRTRFFGEGYSNAIDGNYGIEEKNGVLTRRRNDETLVKIKEHGTPITPSELLHNNSIPEREYYPQIGCLVSWMMDKYGIDKINKLYNLKSDKIEKQFQLVTGVSFTEMEKEYMEYLRNN